jgi:hypothetical protein
MKRRQSQSKTPVEPESALIPPRVIEVDIPHIGPDIGSEIIPISQANARHWEYVQKILEALTEPGTKTLTAACAKLGISRSTGWVAFQSPYVQQQLAAGWNSTKTAGIELISRNWLMMQARLVQIVLKGGEREAVQAARLLSEVYADALKEETQKEGAKSEASLVLERWRNRKAQKVTATRTTVTESVEIADDPSVSARNETVDG